MQFWVIKLFEIHQQTRWNNSSRSEWRDCLIAKFDRWINNACISLCLTDRIHVIDKLILIEMLIIPVRTLESLPCQSSILDVNNEVEKIWEK